MNDPADQKASDEAIKRTTNLTPTGVRQALNATAIDFQRRIDAQSPQPTVSVPRHPPEIAVSETHLDGAPVVLPFQGNDSDNPFPKSSDAVVGTLDNVIIVFNGTADYCQLNGVVTGAV